jgi:hypothetical protein
MLNDRVLNSDHMAWNYLDENESERMLKEAVVAQFKVPFRPLPGGFEKNYEKREDRCPGRYSNRAPPEYKPEASLHEPACSVYLYLNHCFHSRENIDWKPM